MLEVFYRKQFKKDLKRVLKSKRYTQEMFSAVLGYLVAEGRLPAKYRDHELSGDYVGYRECHVAPDWLLIYKVDKGKLTLTLTRTGSHSDLFR